jgi:outer membrane lipoprotein carrier protein
VALMRISKNNIWFLMAVVLLVPVRLPAADFQSVLAGIDRYWETVGSLQASFEQVVEVPALEKSDRFRGTMYFLKPNFIRLEYTRPEGQLLVADGTDWWFYMPQEEIPQVLRAPMEQGDADAPVYILGGRMAERFTGSLAGSESRGGTDCIVLDLEPRGENTYYRTVRAWVHKTTYATRAVRYIDESGNFNTFDLTDVSTGVQLQRLIFSFTPPSDAQVLEAGSPAGDMQ